MAELRIVYGYGWFCPCLWYVLEGSTSQWSQVSRHRVDGWEIADYRVMPSEEIVCGR